VEDMKLPNVLTVEERLSLARVHDHDMTDILHGIFGFSSSRKIPTDEKRNMRKNILCAYTSFYKTIWNLSCSDASYVDKSSSICSGAEMMNDFYEQLRDSLRENFCLNTTSSYLNVPFRETDFMYCVVHNLVKNSLRAGAKQIDIFLEPSRFPVDAIYVPNGARDYDEFMAFRVHDNGRGFPQVGKQGQIFFTGDGFPTAQQEQYRKYLTMCPPEDEHGFGLYFVGLIAKVLRAPIGIQSSPGDTTVSFYHPVFEENEELVQQNGGREI
jgi:hypothetical protein